jgi:hypothetical protein
VKAAIVDRESVFFTSLPSSRKRKSILDKKSRLNTRFEVVGEGKIYTAALLAQQLDGRHLVIAPPHLLNSDRRGSWPNVFGDFQIRQKNDFFQICIL